MTLKQILENYNAEYFENEDDGYKIPIDHDAEGKPHLKGYGLGSTKSQKEINWEQKKADEKKFNEKIKEQHEKVAENVRKKINTFSEQMKQEGNKIKENMSVFAALRYTMEDGKETPILDWYAENQYGHIIARADYILQSFTTCKQKIKKYNDAKEKLKKEAAEHYSVYLSDNKEELIAIVRNENTTYGLRSIVEGIFYYDKMIHREEQNIDHWNEEWEYLQDHYFKFMIEYLKRSI